MKRKPRWTLEMLTASLAVLCCLLLLVLLVLLSPVFLVLAIAIKLDSHGPVFYRQGRVTQNRRACGIFKFRQQVIYLLIPNRLNIKSVCLVIFVCHNNIADRDGTHTFGVWTVIPIMP